METDEEIRKKLVDAIGLESYEGDEEMYLIRDSDGVVESGIDFSDEVTEILSIFRGCLLELEVEFEKELKKQVFSKEEIKDIGPSWSGHPCVGFNKAIDNAIQVLKKYTR